MTSPEYEEEKYRRSMEGNEYLLTNNNVNDQENIEMYSQGPYNLPQEGGEVYNEPTMFQSTHLPFFKTLFFFLIFISSSYLASIYTSDRLLGLSYYSYISLFIGALYIIFLTLLIFSLKSYIKSTLFYFLSLVLTLGVLGAITYIELKPILPVLLYMFYKRYHFPHNIINTSVYALIGVGGCIIYSMILTFISKRINFRGISYKGIKRITYLSLFLTLLVISATYLYVNVFFKEEINIKPISLEIPQCERGYATTEGLLFKTIEGKICKEYYNLLGETKNDGSGDSIFMNEKEITQVHKITEMLKTILSKDKINIKNKRERDMYSLYLNTYDALIISSFTFFNWAITTVNKVMKEYYFYAPSRHDILDESIIDVCSSNFTSLPKEYYVERKKDPSVLIIYTLQHKYGLTHTIALLECFKKLEKETYLVYINKSQCRYLDECPIYASSIYELKQKENLDPETYRYFSRDEDIDSFKNLLQNYINIYDHLIYNYKIIFGDEQINKAEQILKKNTYDSNKYYRYLSLDDFKKISDNEIEFTISYPSQYDDILHLSEKSDIVINDRSLSWRNDTEYEPTVECNKYRSNNRVKYVCKAKNVLIKTNSYNSLMITYITPSHLTKYTIPRIYKYMYAYLSD